MKNLKINKKQAEKLSVRLKKTVKDLKYFLILWSTQSLSQLGSSMTAYALSLWLYEKTGSALQTAALTICSYAPYVVMSILAGALSDRWDKKKTMLICDTVAAACTVIVFILYKTNSLEVWHLYALNAFNGLMNTVQQPAAEVAQTLITPKEYYQKASGFHGFSRSLITILNPIIATAVYAVFGLTTVIFADLGTFAVAFIALLFFVKLPQIRKDSEERETLIQSVGAGLRYLKETPLVLNLILFMSGVNLVASIFDAALPAFVIPNPNGGKNVLGIINSAAGIACLFGSMYVTVMKKPKDRVRVIFRTMLFSLSVENFLLAFAKSPILWFVGQLLGWFVVPIMSANLDVVLRGTIPVEMQGRVYSCRNTLQFFTIPTGLFLGGMLVDNICEPIMEQVTEDGIMAALFGTGLGSGAAMVMFICGVLGITVCLTFGRLLKSYHYSEADEKEPEESENG